MRGRMKLLIKNAIPLVGEFLLLVLGRRSQIGTVTKKNIIMFGGGIGDVVKRSAIAGLVEDYLSEYEVHYLSPLRPAESRYSGASYFSNYTKAKVNPWRNLPWQTIFRGIGFRKDNRIIALL